MSRHFVRTWFGIGLVAVLASLAGLALSPPPDAALAQSATTGSVLGTVVDQATGSPVAGAQVSSPDLGLSATSNASGRFTWSGIPAPNDGLAATIEVLAAGYGSWTIRDVPIFPNDTLLLEVELGPDAVDIQVPPPRSDTSSQTGGPATFLPATVRGGATNPPIPATIRVRVTGYAYCDTSRPYTVQVVDFKEYVKHVLPNEWISSWPREALRAGAMAAKMYAWQIVASGGKWSDADVYDSTCDQVYLPSVSYASTNRAVDFTWNWRLTKDGALVLGSYRAWYSQCVAAGKAGRCIGQWDTYYHALGNNGYAKLTWDEMLYRYYVGSLLAPVWDPPGGFSLRYYGNGWGNIDRVKIPIDAPARPADVGAGDFTIEWWMKAAAADNPSTTVTCGAAGGWVTGNILIDRDVYGPGDLGDFGVSIASGRLAFGAAVGSAGTTVCGASSVADGAWHHLAVTRRASDGRMQIFRDGALDGEGFGPSGDMSYADGRSTGYPNDPFLVLGAEKHDVGAAYPSYNGLIDEMRLSDSLRYDSAFTRPSGAFAPDADTAALYHFDEGFGNTINDVSGAAGGPSQGLRLYGGNTNGPEWTDDSPWFVPQPTPTPYYTPTPTSTPSRTPTPSLTPTATRTPTATSTTAPSATPTRTPTASHTPSPTASATATATPSSTASPMATVAASATPPASPTPANPSDLVSTLSFQLVASGLNQPVFVGDAGDGSGRLFVLERAGRIRVVNAAGTLLSVPFLDITSLVGSSGSEQGLLGLAFHPAYESNGRFFVAYTDNSGSVVLARYRVSSDPALADPASGQILLTIAKPAANHNAGMLAFGPDGYLYLGVGDGGGAGDTANNAQNRTTLLGKIVRLDVDSGSPYAIPADNPYIDDPDPAVKREIWAYGLRNPWRFSFDRSRGDLLIGDVGQGSREEIDYEPMGFAGGGNYGWRVMEGSLCFNPSSGCDSSGKILPVAEYSHAAGNCSVTGGYVYRGGLSPELRGVYLYGDFCSGRLWGLSQTGPGVWLSAELVDTTYAISSFGEDQAGELYLTDYGGGSVVRIRGPQPSTTATPTPSPTPTAISSPTATTTPSASPSPSPSAIASPAATTTPSVSPSATATPTSSPLPTNPAAPTATQTPIPTAAPGEGDVSLDGKVDVVDVQLGVNVILGVETDPGIVARADVNGDGSVDVLDIQRIVNIILQG